MVDPSAHIAWQTWISNNRVFVVGGGIHVVEDGEARYGSLTSIVIIGNDVTIQFGYVSRWDKTKKEWYIPRDKTGPGKLEFKASDVTNFSDRLSTMHQTVTFTVNGTDVTLIKVGSRKLLPAPQTR